MDECGGLYHSALLLGSATAAKDACGRLAGWLAGKLHTFGNATNSKAPLLSLQICNLTRTFDLRPMSVCCVVLALPRPCALVSQCPRVRVPVCWYAFMPACCIPLCLPACRHAGVQVQACRLVRAPACLLVWVLACLALPARSPACLHACVPVRLAHVLASLHACVGVPACLCWCALPAHQRFLVPVCLCACVSACLRACVPACLRACVPACLCACVPVCLRACVRRRIGAWCLCASCLAGLFS